MENMNIGQTLVPSSGLPVCGYANGVARTLGLVTDLTVTQAVVRDRMAGGAKGHVAFEAITVPGPHAWSPPI